jgi:hypothetical protein
VSREEVITQHGVPAELVTFTSQGGLYTACRLIYLHKDSLAFNATFVAARARYADLGPLIDYALSTFQVIGAE